MRKRIYLSVNEETHRLVTRITKQYGFSSTCQMLLTLLMLFVRRVKEREEFEGTETVRDEVDDMFDDFEHWEPSVYDSALPTGGRKITKQAVWQKTKDTED